MRRPADRELNRQEPEDAEVGGEERGASERPLGTTRRARPLALATFAALLVAAAPAGAGVVRLETLEAQVTTARPTVGAARVAGAEAEVELAKSAYMPQFAVTGDLSLAPGGRLVSVHDTSGEEYLVQGTRTVGEEGAFTPLPRYGVVLSAQQRIYDFGRTASAVRAAEAGARAARADDEATRGSRLRTLRVAYLRWVGTQVALESARREKEDAATRRQVVATRIGEGVRARADLGALELREASADLEAVRAEGEVATARLDVEIAVGARLPADATPDTSILDREAPKPPAGDSDATATALDGQRDAALATARAAELGRAPTLAAAAEAGIRGQSEELFPAYRAGVTLVVPLWDGGAMSARAAAARAQAAELSARSRELRDKKRAVKSRAQSEVAGAAARLAAAERLRAAAAKLAGDAEERYRLGDGPVEQVLEARTQLARADHEVLLAKLARAEAALRLREP